MGVPGNANPLLLRTVTAAATGISRSLRFNAGDSAYLSRTMSSASTTYTFAAWVKRSTFPGYQYLFSSGSGGFAFLDTTSTIYVYSPAGGAQETTAVFRDPSAWYHIVFSVNSLSTTVYVNNVAVKTGATAAALSTSTNGTSIGRYDGGGSPDYYFNGYLADIYFIDGQALTPSSFTETDATTGQLIPKAYSGSYGTNGAHLEFADNSAATATTLGKDTSGNGNNWTPNNLSVTAGAGNDSLVDVPTNGAQTDTGVGGEVRGNYCVLNALDTTATLSNGNLDVTRSAATAHLGTRATFGITSGKWYWEATYGAGNTAGSSAIGVALTTWAQNDYCGQTGSWSYHANGDKYLNGAAGTSYGATYTTGDVIGIAFDADAGTITAYKNGASQGQLVSGLTAGPYFPASSVYNASSWTYNFGQRAFAYTAPSGFKALCTANLPAPSVTKGSSAMDVALWTGNNVNNRQITGLGFSPDLVWIKSRSSAAFHNLTDIVRGTGLIIQSNTTSSEQNSSSHNGAVGAFNSDGFTLTQGLSLDDVNASATTYVGWAFDGGSSTVTNTAGSISSQVRANATAGFSIATFTSPTGTGNFSVGHGLGVTPEMVIVKSRDAAGVWYVYHKSLATDYYLRLNGTNAAATDGVQWGAGMTSTVLGFRASYSTVAGATTVAYAFAPVSGYSSFGSYTGNGSTDGPFVYTGFRPAFVMLKVSAGASANWTIVDSKRDTYNVAKTRLFPSDSQAENTGADNIDILSNGFKLRVTEDGANGNTRTYIYAAFAESPFNYARAR